MWPVRLRVAAFALLTCTAPFTNGLASKPPMVIRDARYTIPLTRHSYFLMPEMEVTVGGQTMMLLLDSAVSDLWVMGPNFHCHGYWDEGWKPEPLIDCTSHPLYHTDEFSGGQIPDRNFNLSFANGGDLINGRVGYETITIGGLTIPKQPIAIVDDGSWEMHTSGGIGLSFPLYGSTVYSGTDPRQDKESERTPITPWFLTAFQDKLVDPVVGFVFEENPDPGQYMGKLVLGGVPEDAHDGSWATTPLLKGDFHDLRGGPISLEGVAYPDYTYIKFKMDAIVSNGKKVTFSDDEFCEVDTATTYYTIPVEVLRDVAAAFDPPYRQLPYSNDHYPFYGPCNVTANVSYSIGGVELAWDLDHLIFQNDTTGTVCRIAVYIDYDATFGRRCVIGQTFLNQVITAIDFGALTLQMAKRNK